MNRLLISLAALLLMGPLSAKQPTMPDKAAQAAPTFSTISGNPLQINVGSDNSYQVFNTAAPGLGQIYPSSATETADMGWFVRVGNTLHSPNFGGHPGGTATGGLGSATPFNEVSLSPVNGAGTTASPFTVSVVNVVGSTGLTATKTISYVDGDSYFTERFRLVNLGTSVVQATVFLGSDIFLASSDSGVPYLEPTSSSPGGRTCAGVVPEYTILHIPLTPATRYTAVTYSSVWSQIGQGGNLDNTVATGCIDNGAALQWDVTIQPGGSATILAGTSFGPVPPITQFNIIDVTPFLGVVGSTVAVTISGYGFQPNSTFNFGAGITVTNLVVQGPTRATATLVISPTAAIGWRDVTVTQSPGGLVATLIEGFAVTEPPIWNYTIFSVGNVNIQAINCVRDRFPGNPATNAPGWAPSEGEFYHEDPQQQGVIVGPNILARAILDCFMGGRSWDEMSGMLYPIYCWDDPSPTYMGEYPDIRVANLRVYFAYNNECLGPIPGWPMAVEENVPIMRQLFYPLPMVRSGFEAP
jgi:hypothetical protein